MFTLLQILDTAESRVISDKYPGGLLAYGSLFGPLLTQTLKPSRASGDTPFIRIFITESTENAVHPEARTSDRVSVRSRVPIQLSYGCIVGKLALLPILIPR